MDPVVLLVAGWATAVFGAVRMRREPRRLSTGFLLLVALSLVLVGAATAAARVAAPAVLDTASLVVAGLFLLAVLATGLGLLGNGIAVMLHEGVRPITLTPVLAGIGLLVLPVAAALALRRGPEVPPWLLIVATATTLAGVYLLAHLLAFAGHAVVYDQLPDDTGPDAIVVLGCGLNRNKVTPLLASRLQRALRVYRAETAAGRGPLLVTSGGKGSDEALSEADAMATYLIRAGVSDESIVRERESRNTEENLRNSLALLRDAGIDVDTARITVVTSNFHVLRAAALTRRLGVRAHVAGARTALYFIPAAFLREFAAVLTTHYRRAHVAVATAAAIAIPAAAAQAYLIT
ncbi:YdcF family protein [Nocardia asteroides]|uniref:YdcF family protein n=1 Tax=Nocardia asteroides TaxID=1824 RepID=UPI001E35B1C4|nr:YdcF family protein [Nocardia asteroides]UGT61613.1 YdcF family protein [Nocardia asteroides]